MVVVERHFNKKWDNTIYHRENGKLVVYPEYNQWKVMSSRCGQHKSCAHREKFYSDTECSETFKDFDKYMEWAKKQVGFLCRDEDGNLYQIDKDFLVKGNKLYSEDTCVFIPKFLNSLLLTNKRVRGKHLLGVHYDKHNGAYKASISFKIVLYAYTISYVCCANVLMSIRLPLSFSSSLSLLMKGIMRACG